MNLVSETKTRSYDTRFVEITVIKTALFGWEPSAAVALPSITSALLRQPPNVAWNMSSTLAQYPYMIMLSCETVISFRKDVFVMRRLSRENSEMSLRYENGSFA
jgi:hypothetical protein